MGITTISSRDFNQDTSGAKKASKNGPVVITDRGKPSHVLMSIEEYQRLTGSLPSIVDLIAMPSEADIDFDPQPTRINIKPAELA
jgi:prevent-host-death family protein